MSDFEGEKIFLHGKNILERSRDSGQSEAYAVSLKK
nr:MAG TPA: hypothetical protein [Caudoviricetes sp.]